MTTKESKRHSISVRDVRMSQDLSLAQIPLIMRHVFVPLSWPLTVLAAALGLSPNATTFIRLAIVVLATFIMATGSQVTFLLGVLVFVFGVVLDSVDGNLCRLNGQASYFGKFLDGLVDIISDLMFPIAVSAYLWKQTGADDFIWLGILAHFSIAVTIITLYRVPLFEMSARLENANDDQRSEHPSLREILSSKPVVWIETHAMNCIFDLRYLGLLTGLLFSLMGVYMIGLTAIYILAMAIIVPIRILRAYVEIDIGRQSRSAKVRAG